jgi:hypothetical protein
VFLAVGHGEAGDVERLSIDVAGNGAVFIDGTREENAEGGRRESRGRESVLFEVLPRALGIVVMSVDAGEIGDGNGDGSRSGGIGNTRGCDGVGALIVPEEELPPLLPSTDQVTPRF